MRIVIASAPKCGNVWLKCLLAMTYDLKALWRSILPQRPELADFAAWLADGSFPDKAIFHQHFDYSDDLAAAIEGVPAKLVTIVRDPYDAWVSSFFTLQRAPDDAARTATINPRRSQLIGKPIDHPDVLRQLERGGYGKTLTKAVDWMDSGRAAMVRYEDLHRDPIAALGTLTQLIAPVPPERIDQAIETCHADNMRQMSPGLATHVRTARVGDAHDLLSESHLAIFRDRYADHIRRLGYEVR